MQPTGTTSARAFSIVTAVYNVGRYLDAFFASLEAQSFGIDQLQLVLVDDGSTDDSLARCEAFAAAWPGSVIVIQQQNGGQASARNRGLAEATGTWVTFTDPDDTLDSEYFTEVALALERFTNASMASASIIMHHEASGVREDKHPLRRKFQSGTALFHLDVDSDAVQMSAATAFFRRDRIEAHALRFDERLRPTFEDCAFIARYLLATPDPTLAAVATARYYYRKRADASSSIEQSASDPRKYSTVLEHGHLAVLEQARTATGAVPRWLQNMVIYDLSWYLHADAAVQSKTGALSPEVLAEFHERVASIRALIDADAIEVFGVMPISDDIRFALLHGFGSPHVAPATVEFTEADHAARLVLLRYRFTGERPVEQVFVDGVAVKPAYSKYRAIMVYGRLLARERILWVPVGDRVRISLDGRPMVIDRPTPPTTDVIENDGPLQWDAPRRDLRPASLQNPGQSLTARARARLHDAFSKPRLFETLLSIALHSAPVRRRYHGAWVMIDRERHAGDSAETLYRYLAEHQPQVRPYFVLRRDGVDWSRLRRSGVRLIPYGSWRWQLLMLSAAHVASSHADLYVIRPLAPRRFGLPQFRFTFLQHGVIKDDLSRWLNSKRIDLLITSTRAEYDSLVADDTPYVVSEKEVRLTGLPRFDDLLAKRAAVPANARRLVLITPTWRLGLVPEISPHVAKGGAKPGFAQSAYAKQWSALLASDTLRELAEANSLQLVFMPHPNMSPYLDEFDAPAHVRIAGYDDDDIQQLLAETRLLVTDYSSVAFNAAVIDVPTVYFQFDQDDFYSGAHPTRRGYLDYEADGFGPVCTTVDEVERGIADLVTDAGAASEYAARARRTIEFHDRENSRRVFEAISALDRPFGER